MNGTRNLRNSTNKEMQSYSGYKTFQGDHKLCLLFFFSLKILPTSDAHICSHSSGLTLTRWLKLSF